MCGRFALSAKTAQLEKLLPGRTVKISAILTNRYNIAPTQNISAIMNANTDELSSLKWGLIPSWAKDDSLASKMINARAETIFEKPSFKNLIVRRRCLIPASGYFEWKIDPSSKGKIPYYIKNSKDELFTFAGLWDSWKNNENEIINSVTIVTCQPNDKLSAIHNRMPVIINPDDRINWLENNLTKTDTDILLLPADPDLFDFYEVDKKVNISSFDSEECVNPKYF